MTIQKGIYLVYTNDIPKINLAYDHLCHIPGIYQVKTLWVCSVPVTYPTDIPKITHISSKHIPFELSYDGYIPGIYPNYFMYIQHVFKSSNTDGPFS